MYSMTKKGKDLNKLLIGLQFNNFMEDYFKNNPGVKAQLEYARANNCKILTQDYIDEIINSKVKSL